MLTVATLWWLLQRFTMKSKPIQINKTTFKSFARGRKGLHCVTKRVGFFTSYTVRAAIRAVHWSFPRCCHLIMFPGPFFAGILSGPCTHIARMHFNKLTGNRKIYKGVKRFASNKITFCCKNYYLKLVTSLEKQCKTHAWWHNICICHELPGVVKHCSAMWKIVPDSNKKNWKALQRFGRVWNALLSLSLQTCDVSRNPVMDTCFGTGTQYPVQGICVYKEVQLIFLNC